MSSANVIMNKFLLLYSFNYIFSFRNSSNFIIFIKMRSTVKESKNSFSCIVVLFLFIYQTTLF
jgi:hypothetical protein